MKTIVLASQKGGVGKTTLAGHLAVAAEKAGAGPVVVIDTDPQGSLAAWWNAREASAPAFSPLTSDLAGQLAGLAAAGVALVIIDTPPQRIGEHRRHDRSRRPGADSGAAEPT